MALVVFPFVEKLYCLLKAAVFGIFVFVVVGSRETIGETEGIGVGWKVQSGGLGRSQLSFWEWRRREKVRRLEWAVEGGERKRKEEFERSCWRGHGCFGGESFLQA